MLNSGKANYLESQQFVASETSTITLTVGTNDSPFLVLISHNGGNHFTLFAIKIDCNPVKIGGSEGVIITKLSDGSTFSLTVTPSTYPYYTIAVFGCGYISII